MLHQSYFQDPLVSAFSNALHLNNHFCYPQHLPLTLPQNSIHHSYKEQYIQITPCCPPTFSLPSWFCNLFQSSMRICQLKCPLLHQLLGRTQRPLSSNLSMKVTIFPQFLFSDSYKNLCSSIPTEFHFLRFLKV